MAIVISKWLYEHYREHEKFRFEAIEAMKREGKIVVEGMDGKQDERH